MSETLSEIRGEGPTPSQSEMERIRRENQPRPVILDSDIIKERNSVEQIKEDIAKLKQLDSYKDSRDKSHQWVMTQIGTLQDKLLRVKETAGVK